MQVKLTLSRNTSMKLHQQYQWANTGCRYDCLLRPYHSAKKISILYDGTVVQESSYFFFGEGRHKS